jgi:phosphate transport system protein
MRRASDDEFERQLQTLHERVELMGRTVEDMLAGGLRAFVERDSDRARRTIERDDIVDRLEKETDDLGLKLLAQARAEAADLRFMAMAPKIVSDIERIGDMAVNICRRALELNEKPPLHHCVDIRRLGDAALWMMHEALAALNAGDAETARAVIEQDDVLDGYHSQIHQELLGCMMDDRDCIARVAVIQSVAKDVERVGDFATNIAEMVVFVVKGEDIRHTAGPSARTH